MRKTPKITVLLATCNRAHLIGETLDSIIAQTYTNWECIIVDDYSKDNTAETIRKYSEKDSRFSYYHKLMKYNKGLSGTRNYGLDIAKKKNAQFIQFFDDDDIMHPHKLKLQVDQFLEDPDLDLVLCKYEGFTNDENPLEIEPYSKIPIESNNLAEDFLFDRVRINSAGPIFKTYLFEDERFDETLPYGEEKELFLRIFFKYKPKSAAVNEYLFFYRHHPVSITAGKSNYLEKIGANFIIPQKLWDYLDGNSLLTKKTTGYLLRQFLLKDYNKPYIERVEKFLDKRKLSFFQRMKFKVIIGFHQFYRKTLYKLMLQ